MPHRVVALALPQVVTFDLGCAVQVFHHRTFAENPRADELYEFCVASTGSRRVPTADGLTLTTEAGPKALAEADTIVVPGYASFLEPPPAAAIRALQAAADRGARVMSICTGAFALAHAGLLDGLRATTHWAAAPLLARDFPAVQVDPDVLYIDTGQILTSAGLAAGLDLALHVVRRDHGPEAAAARARWNVVAPHRDGGQAQYAVQPAQHDPGFGLAATRAWALERLEMPLNLEDLSAHACCSERTFTRRFRAETGTSPQQWLAQMRLQKARELLETTDLPIELVSVHAGFSSPAGLRARFTSELKTTPSAYRRHFSTAPRAVPSRG